MKQKKTILEFDLQLFDFFMNSVTVYFLDGSSEEVPIDDYTTIEDVCARVSFFLSLFLFCLFLVNKKKGASPQF